MANNMQSIVEKVKSFNVKDKPFTEKLFLRAAKSVDDLMITFKEAAQANKLKEIQGNKAAESLESFSLSVESISDSIIELEKLSRLGRCEKLKDEAVGSFATLSTLCITQEINEEVVKRNNIENKVLFTNVSVKNKSKEALSFIVLFNLWCAMAIGVCLENDGVEVNKKDLLVGVLKQFVLEKDEERSKQVTKGYELLQELINTKDDNVLKWYNHLISVIQIYIMSFENMNKNISEEDNIALISMLFKKMMSAYSE